MRVGALAPLGLSLSQLFAAENGLAEPIARGRAKSVILVFLGGGLSHLDTFDPKPEAVEEIRGKYRSIATSVPGLRVTELLPKTAQIMNKVALVRSGYHESDQHETATNWVLSGRSGSRFGDHPAMGAVVAHQTDFGGAVPPYVAVPKNPSFMWELGRSAWLGERCEAFQCGDPNVASFGDASPRDVGSTLSPQARAIFDIARGNTKCREAYGHTEFGRSCLLARRLVEGGARFVTVNHGGWDHHKSIFDGLETKAPEFDTAFSALIRDLDQRGLLAETLVVALSEFGRTPKINKDAGRDHWSQAGSLIFAGAGVQGGQVIGSTDKHGAFVTERPVRPAEVCWTVYNALGIDPTKELRSPEGRPVSILDQGGVISELYS